MVLKNEDVEKCIKWTTEWKTVFVSSKNDYMKVRNGIPSPEFWDLWKGKKDEIKKLGISVKKVENEEKGTSEWIISAWLDTTDKEKAQAQQTWQNKMTKRSQKEEREEDEEE